MKKDRVKKQSYIIQNKQEQIITKTKQKQKDLDHLAFTTIEGNKKGDITIIMKKKQKQKEAKNHQHQMEEHGRKQNDQKKKQKNKTATL